MHLTEEIESVKRYGFTATELERAKKTSTRTMKEPITTAIKLNQIIMLRNM